MWYPVAVEIGDDKTACGLVVPDIPGCFSAGDTFDEALASAREAIDLHLQSLAEHGEPIPRGSEVSRYLNDPEYAGWVWAAVEVDVTPYLGRSHKINVTLPDMLIKHIDDRVSRHPGYKTRSGFLAEAALHELTREKK